MWKTVALFFLVLGLAISAVNAVSMADRSHREYFGTPGWVYRGTVPASIDFDFASSRYYQAGHAVTTDPGAVLKVSRASIATNLLPTSPAGFAYTTFGPNIPRIMPGSGVLIWQSVTNYLRNSGSPATQTTGSLGVTSYALWVNGPGSATFVERHGDRLRRRRDARESCRVPRCHRRHLYGNGSRLAE